MTVADMMLMILEISRRPGISEVLLQAVNE